MPSVEPRSRCDSVQGHSPRRIRSASSAMLRREATISATVSSAGEVGELLTPVATQHAVFGAGGVIDRGGRAADQRDQLQVRQPLDQRAGEFHPLPDRNDDVGGVETLDQFIEAGGGRAVARDGVVPQQGEAVQPVDDVLVVVGDDDVHRQ